MFFEMQYVCHFSLRSHLAREFSHLVSAPLVSPTKRRSGFSRFRNIPKLAEQSIVTALTGFDLSYKYRLSLRASGQDTRHSKMAVQLDHSHGCFLIDCRIDPRRRSSGKMAASP